MNYFKFCKSLFFGLSTTFGQTFKGFFSWCVFHMSVLDYFQLFGFVFWQIEKDKFQHESRQKLHCLLFINYTVIWKKAVACPCLGETILNLEACVPCYLEYSLLPSLRNLSGIQLSGKTSENCRLHMFRRGSVCNTKLIRVLTKEIKFVLFQGMEESCLKWWRL